MPIVVVHGVSRLKDRSQFDLKMFLEQDLPEAVASVEELDIDPSNVTVFAPEGQTNNPSAVVIFVEGLFQRPERTQEVLQRLAYEVREATVTFAESCLVDCEAIEVILRSQNPIDGYSVWQAD